MSVDGGGFEQIPDAQGVELVHVRVGETHAVTLVHRQGHRLAGLAEHGSHVHIGGGHAGANVHDHYDAIGQQNADLRLTAHEFQHIVLGARLNAAGIHQRKFPSAPLAVSVNAVTGHAGGILHDGGPPAGKFIKEHGFAHVRSAHNGHQRLAHIQSSFLAAKNGRMFFVKLRQIKEKAEGETAFRCACAFSCLSQPWQQEPDGHCRYRRPCRLCGA